MTVAGERLYLMLPAHIRMRDVESGSPIRTLLDVIGMQTDAIAADLLRAYENLFIETSEAWVIPYLAELVGTTPLYDASRSDDDATALAAYTDVRGPRLLAPVGASARADVARTISLRRRKGTVSALKDVASYATGWPVHVVEGIMRDARTAHARHVRPDLQTEHVANRLESYLVGRPFDTTSRFVDVRTPDGAVGWYHPRHVTVAVYRHGTQDYRRTIARPGAAAWQFKLDPLSLDRALFTKASEAIELPPSLASGSVPVELAPALFEADLRDHKSTPLLATGSRPGHTALYAQVGEDSEALAACLGIWLDGSFVTPAQDESAPINNYKAKIVSRNLNPWPLVQPSGKVVAVDVRCGRVAIGAGLTLPTKVEASFFHGTSGTVGGGSYDRAAWMIAGRPDRVVTVGAAGADFATLTSAITSWLGDAAEHTLIRIVDSETYAIQPGLTSVGRSLVIESANGQRPVLQPEGGAVLTLDGSSRFTFSGVAIDGRLVVEGEVESLRLMHVTMPPQGQLKPDDSPVSAGPSIYYDGAQPRFRLEAAFSIIGEIRLNQDMDQLQLLDSLVVDSTGFAITVTGGD